MFNLRQLNKTSEESTATSDVQRSAALNFRVPTSSLGNIGEPLDYGQAQQELYQDDDDTGIVDAEVAVTQSRTI